MRRASKKDTNHTELMRVARDEGALVKDTHALGEGYPDFTMNVEGVIGLVEVKAKGGRLTIKERAFHAKWGGPFCRVCRTGEDIIEFVAWLRQVADMIREMEL